MYFGLMILAGLKYIVLGQLCVEVEVAIGKVGRYKWTGIVRDLPCRILCNPSNTDYVF
jgi:hypothetical protein